MKKSTSLLILFGIILVATVMRLHIAGSESGFSDDTSYYILRHIEAIQDQGKPLYDDPLSYGGREATVSPGYFYFLYAASAIGTEKLIIITALIASLASLIIYFISLRLTKNNHVSYIAAGASAFIPIFFQETTNTLSATVITVPCLLLCTYLFTKIGATNTKKQNLQLIEGYVILLVAFCFISASSFILLLTLLAYVIILRIEEIPLDKTKRELIIFTTFFILWSQFLIYKDAMLIHGPNVIWQGIPLELIINYFAQIDILTTMYSIGIIPFCCGMYILYKYSFKTKNEHVYVYIALTLIVALLLLTRLIELNLGLVYLGFCFIIFFSICYKQLLTYVEKTKLSKYTKHIILAVVVIFIISSIIPSYALAAQKETVSKELNEALLWIKENTNQESTILGTSEEGHVIAAVAKRKNVIDTNFLLVKESTEKYDDVKRIYTSASLVKAVELLDFYEVDYILFDAAQEEFGIAQIKYSESECIEEVYTETAGGKNIRIYKIQCVVEKHG